jgi:hypothetical protein
MAEEYSLKADHVSIKTSSVVKLKEYFTLISEEGPIDITANIEVDFEGINPKYHEVLLNMLTSKYLKKVSYGDNPFSQCKPLY